MSKKCKHLVADSAAFIRFCDLRSIADKIYTTREVIAEIRDKESRKRLQMLPYDLIFKNIDPKYLKEVYKVAKTTGKFIKVFVIIQLYELKLQFCSSLVSVRFTNYANLIFILV